MPIAQNIIDRTLGTSLGEQGYRIAEALLDAGHEAWWVGGCVRDMLLGELPNEIDIATDANPQQVAALFPRCDDSAAALGAIVVAQGGHTYEVTTYREEDDLSDGRTPESVSFTNRENDAKRRDITVNAIYWNPISGELFDPFEGEKDLNERLVRLIGNAEERLTHDALRLLRVIRFRARINGQYHPDTFKALHAKARSIEILSGSRRFQELEKILLGPRPNVAFEDLWETDVIEYLLPELHACKGVAQPKEYHLEGDVWNHEMNLIASFTEDHKEDVRWAGLLHDIGKPKTFSIENDRIHFNDHASVGADISKDLLGRLQCPAKRRDKICWLIKQHMMMGNFLDMSDERKAHWYYHPWFIELLQLFWLDIAGSTPQDFSLYERIIKDYNHFLDSHPRPPKPLLKGEEVMEILGIQPGEKVGEVMKTLDDAQVRKEVRTREEARAFVEKLR